MSYFNRFIVALLGSIEMEFSIKHHFLLELLTWIIHALSLCRYKASKPEDIVVLFQGFSNEVDVQRECK